MHALLYPLIAGALLAAGPHPLAPPAAPADEAVHDHPPAPLTLLDTRVPAGERALLQLAIGQSFFGQPLDIPVTVVHGPADGPSLCLVAAIHGDELNGIEVVRRVLEELDPDALSGTVIGMPVVNVQGFTQGSRYLPDRRDLNRYFPGRVLGSFASRMAHQVFNDVILRCDYLVDFHTGSFKRSNLPQLRADMNHPAVRAFAEQFGVPILHKPAGKGTLRGAALAQDVVVVAFELGEPSTIQPEHVEAGVASIRTLLESLAMLAGPAPGSAPQTPPQPAFYKSHWVRVNHGGILTAAVRLGDDVEKKTLLGTSINPLTNERYEVRSPVAGKVLGMARSQFMLPGFAAFHIGSRSAVPTTPLPAGEPAPEGSEEFEMDSE